MCSGNVDYSIMFCFCGESIMVFWLMCDKCERAFCVAVFSRLSVYSANDMLISVCCSPHGSGATPDYCSRQSTLDYSPTTLEDYDTCTWYVEAIRHSKVAFTALLFANENRFLSRHKKHLMNHWDSRQTAVSKQRAEHSRQFSSARLSALFFW